MVSIDYNHVTSAHAQKASEGGVFSMWMCWRCWTVGLFVNFPYEVWHNLVELFGAKTSLTVVYRVSFNNGFLNVIFNLFHFCHKQIQSSGNSPSTTPPGRRWPSFAHVMRLESTICWKGLLVQKTCWRNYSRHDWYGGWHSKPHLHSLKARNDYKNSEQDILW